MIGLADVARWADELSALHGRIGRHFVRAEPRRRALAYLRALLSPIDRKNGWQLAEQAGEATPDGMQHLLRDAQWDADAVREDLRTYVIEQLGDPTGVLAVDETGFLKKGTKSVGVQRQYSGTAGRVENCQIGVFLTYAGSRGWALIDRDLYLPESWVSDAARRQQAGVPETVAFAPKGQLGLRLLERALDAGVPCAWVTGDEVYGQDSALRTALERRAQPYVLTVRSSATPRVETGDGSRPLAVAVLADALEAADWSRLSAGDGAKGPRWYDWGCIALADPCPAGFGRWLLVRRSVTDPTDRAYFFVFARETTPLTEVVRAAGTRWTVEESFEAGKGEVGLDHYEVRRWDGWYRHVTLAMLALAFLAVVRARAAEEPEEKKGRSRSDPGDYSGSAAPAGLLAVVAIP